MVVFQENVYRVKLFIQQRCRKIRHYIYPVKTRRNIWWPRYVNFWTSQNWTWHIMLKFYDPTENTSNRNLQSIFPLTEAYGIIIQQAHQANEKGVFSNPPPPTHTHLLFTNEAHFYLSGEALQHRVPRGKIARMWNWADHCTPRRWQRAWPCAEALALSGHSVGTTIVP